LSEWYCPLPFRHAYVDSNGVSACCNTPRYANSIKEWYTHPALQELRQNFIKGHRPDVCSGCWKSEQLQGRSLRTDSNLDYNHAVYQEAKIDFIDFRSVNICNFRCRSCNPVFSHGIAQEVNKWPGLEKFFFGPMPKTKTLSVSDTNIEWIMNNLSGLKRIMLTGGEPTAIPEIKKLIEKLRQSHSDTMIMITSNASFQDDFWREITLQLPNLHWTVSIDIVGNNSAIVRHGSEWSIIEDNVRWLAQYSNSLDINSVVSNLTVFGLRPLLQFGQQMQAISRAPHGRHGDLGCRHQFFVCQRPYYLAADNWPDDDRSRVLDYLKSCHELDLDQEQKNMIQGLIRLIERSIFDPALWTQTQEYNRLLNEIRNEDHTVLYQEQ